MILLALIIFYKTNIFAKLYHDQISLSGVRVAKISLKKSIFPIFGTYPFFKFLSWPQISSIRFLRWISTHKHQIPKYLELLKCRERLVWTQYWTQFFVVFGQYWTSLRAIISIITKDNWLLHGFFGQLKQSPIRNAFFQLKCPILAEILA